MTKTTKATVSTRLLAQRHKDSPIGDLARDAYDDASFPRRASASTIRRYLRARGACHEALRAFDAFCRQIGERVELVDTSTEDT